MEFVESNKEDGDVFDVEGDRILVNGMPFATAGEWIVVSGGGMEAIDETEYAERNHKGELEQPN